MLAHLEMLSIEDDVYPFPKLAPSTHTTPCPQRNLK
jgi:hypothetical protein